MIMLAASVLPEFGHLISSAPGKSTEDQFKALYHHFLTATMKTKSLILTSFVKFSKTDPSLNSKILPVFEKYKTSWDEEIQQRCIEYEQMILLSSTSQEAKELF